MAWTDIYAGAKLWYEGTWLLSSYYIWNGLVWLTAEAVELAGPVPFCIENSKAQAQVGWTLTSQCQTHILGHAGRHRIVHGLLFPLGHSGWVAHMSGLPCMGIGLAVVPRGGLIACVLAVCC